MTTPAAVDQATADDRLTFTDLGVRPDIERALTAVGITHPFPIQSLAIPIAIDGTDLIGQARTGTGKTLAFGISLLQRVLLPGDEGYDEWPTPGKPQALVMCPTRELALQVTRDLEVASTFRKARVMTVYGGVGYDLQLDALAEGVDVVVGTPGRLLDLANRRSLDLAHLRVLVLDEADEMLDLGFLPDVERLIGMTPLDRQTMLFSATMPAAVMSLARTHLSQPVNVRAEGHDASATVPDTTQLVYQAHDLDKPEIIGKLLQVPDIGKVMIFTRTKRSAQRLADELEDRGFAAASIHGDLAQASRERALKRFRAGKVRVLVATDVAARGIDVTGVSHVINHECPDNELTYIHRIGRTGRAGAKGIAVTLVDWADLTRWNMINKALDLGIEEPAETYSTSPKLFADLGIPEGVKGRLPGAQPKDVPHHGRPTDEDRPSQRDVRAHPRVRRQREEHDEIGVERPREPRKASTRTRRRMRNGRPVGDRATQTSATDSSGEAARGDTTS